MRLCISHEDHLALLERVARKCAFREKPLGRFWKANITRQYRLRLLIDNEQRRIARRKIAQDCREQILGNLLQRQGTVEASAHLYKHFKLAGPLLKAVFQAAGADFACGSGGQFGGIEGLDEIVVSAHPETAFDVQGITRGGRHDDDRHARRKRIAAQNSHRLEAIHARHLDVHQDQIGVQLAGLFDSLLAVARLFDTIVLALEDAPEQHARLNVVVRHQYQMGFADYPVFRTGWFIRRSNPLFPARRTPRAS